MNNFHGGIDALEPEELFGFHGPGWGQFTTSTLLDLILHAQREVVHHGAEISLPRDLHRSGAMLG